MNFKQNTGKSIGQAFAEYHSENPHVYDKFKELAFLAIKKGKKKISFKLILNVIRWEYFIQTSEQTSLFLEGEHKTFKINDAYGSRYARLFISEFPKLEDKIELRRLRS